MTRPDGQKRFQTARKLWHILGIIPPILIYLDAFRYAGGQEGLTRPAFLLLYILAVALILFMDFMRLRISGFENFFYRYLGFLMKPEEKNRINATVPLLFGQFLLFVFFSSETAVMASLFLIFGDPAAAFVGQNYGKIRMKNGKSLEGLLAFTAAGILASLVFLLFHAGNTHPYDPFHLFLDSSVNLTAAALVVFGSLAAAVSEFFSSNRLFGLIDDNLTVPLAGAAAISLAGFYLLDMPFSSVFYDIRILFDFL